MSNELLQEIQMDLAYEKEKIFFQKYKYIILGFISVILLGVVGYQYYTSYQEKALLQSANNYQKILQFYSNNDSYVDESTVRVPDLSKVTLENVPSYLAMSTLIELTNAQKQDVSLEELHKITQRYMNSMENKPLTIYDSLIHIFDLSLQVSINTDDFDVIEQRFLKYLNHPYAFNFLAYEVLFFQSIRVNNIQQAKHYLKNLQDNAHDARMKNKVRVFQTHPYLLEGKQDQKQSDKKEEKKE